VTEWLAFGECRNEYCNEGEEEKNADSMQTNLVAPLPESFCHALEEFGYCEFGHPDAVLDQ
jgi:hypothetical protein